MEKKSLSNAASKIIGGIVLLILLSIIPAAAETKLHPFLKKEKVKVEPNVLLLIDTSGSMAFRMEDDDKTWGDGTRPYKKPGTNNWGIYYGFDNEKHPDSKKRNNDNNDASSDYNYHPLLRFIPSQELVAAGISTTVADKWFAKRVSGVDPDSLPGESDYKYPNDSRMYVLKNVMYRILSDETLVSNIRLALSTYHQTGPTWNDSSSSNYHYWPPSDSGNSQGIYWRGGDDKAMLHENFDSTTNTNHLNNIKKWFDGEDDGDHKELRAHGATPLAASIYQSSDSAKKFFEDKDKNGKNVVSERCQDNWLVVLTDGADTQGGDAATAVRNLYNLFKNKNKKEIKTFVIGLIDPEASKNKDLVKTLAKMADYGDDGVLSDTYGSKWTLENSKASKNPYFPRNMEGLFKDRKSVV